MKKYKLKKDLPTFKAGQECWVGIDGQLLTQDEDSHVIMVYASRTMQKFPNILADWFEEIPEEPKTVWDLKEGDECWILSVDLELLQVEWRNTPCDNHSRELGLIYLTKEELERELARRKAKQILLRDTKGFKPDWKRCNFGWTVTYEMMDKNPHFRVDWTEWVDETIRFATEEDAEASIAMHEKEWKIYLSIGEY